MPARARRYIGRSVMSLVAEAHHAARPGGTSPTTMEKVVVLPAPLGPSRPTISPAATSSETSRTTVRPP